MTHDAPWEHHHEIGDPLASLEDVVVWKTVGLDVGSATSQIVFSEISLVREDSRYVVAERRVLHESAVILTPFTTPELIDRERLADFIDREFSAAGMSRSDVDTGAVILTGLALATDNARAVADAVADESGRFVAVSAGDLLEAKLAAYGAGVPAMRAKGLLLHIDIGGGTTKFSSWRRGKLVDLAAIDVGARLLTFDAKRRIVQAEAPALRVAALLGLQISIGHTVSADHLQRLARSMAAEILHFAGVLEGAPHFGFLRRTAPLSRRARVTVVVFSGGVSEYIYGREKRAFGDLGKLLGVEILALLGQSKTHLMQSERGIRATVLGASQHSVQLSGNTVFVSHPELLPLRNIPVLLPYVDLSAEQLDRASIALEIEHAAWHCDHRLSAGAVAVALRWQGSATYDRLRTIADALALALNRIARPENPCVVVVDGDIAGVLGWHLQEACGGKRAIVCVDTIEVTDLDYLDIGAFTAKTRALPVIVKSLLFAAAGSASTAFRRHRHSHRHDLKGGIRQHSHGDAQDHDHSHQAPDRPLCPLT